MRPSGLFLPTPQVRCSLSRIPCQRDESVRNPRHPSFTQDYAKAVSNNKHDEACQNSPCCQMVLSPKPPPPTAEKLSTVLLSATANNWVLPKVTSIKKQTEKKELKKKIPRDTILRWSPCWFLLRPKHKTLMNSRLIKIFTIYWRLSMLGTVLSTL